MIYKNKVKNLALLLSLYSVGELYATTILDLSNNPVIDAFGSPLKTGSYYYILSIRAEGSLKDTYNGVFTHNASLGMTAEENAGRGVDKLSLWCERANSKKKFWYFDNRFVGWPAGQTMSDAYEIRNFWGDHLKFNGTEGNQSVSVVANTDGTYFEWKFKPSGVYPITDVYTNVQFYQITNWNVFLSICVPNMQQVSAVTTSTPNEFNQFCFIPLAIGANGAQYIPDGKTVLGFGGGVRGSGNGTWSYIANPAGLPITCRGGTQWDSLSIGNSTYGGPGGGQGGVYLIPQNGEFTLLKVTTKGNSDNGDIVMGITMDFGNGPIALGTNANNPVSQFPTSPGGYISGNTYVNMNTIANFLGVISQNGGGGYVATLYFKIVRLELLPPQMN